MDSCMPLDPKRCVLFIIDPQERLMAAIPEAERVIENSALLVRAAKVFSIPVILTTQYRKGIGPIVPELQELLAGIEAIDKMEFDALSNEAVSRALSALPGGCDTLILTGVEAHICVHQTAISAMNKGWSVVICEDAVSSRNKEHKKAAVRNFVTMDMKVYPAETIVFELLKKAGTKEFKTLLPYIK